MAKGDFTKVKQITPATKQKVYERQHGRSIFSNKRISINECCCHFIGRGNSGVGFEWNIFGCTYEEHDLYDESKPIGDLSHEECELMIIRHMQENYDNWGINKCYFKKYCYEEKDYEVNRNSKR